MTTNLYGRLLTDLSHREVLRAAFDEDTNRIKTETLVEAVVAGGTEVIISHEDDSIRIGDGTDLVGTTTADGNVGLNVAVVKPLDTLGRVRTVIEAGTVEGAFTPSGLKIGLRITTMDVTSAAPLKLPATELTNRNTLSITNLSETDTLYIGDSSVTSGRTNGTTCGWEVGPNEGFNIDITDDVVLYGITESGKTVKIKVLEVA